MGYGPYELNTRSGLPTQRCTDQVHELVGGACAWCCVRCSFGRHRCPACGATVRHDGRAVEDGSEHSCVQS